MKYNRVPFTSSLDEKYITEKVKQYDHSIVPPEPGASDEELVFKINNENGDLIAGINIETDCWSKVYIDNIWVDERYHKQGLGSLLLVEAERIAKEKGCYVSILDTFDFQARPFYEKHGYRLCGTVENWPRGHCCYFLTKRLDQPFQVYIPLNSCHSKRYYITPGSREDGLNIMDRLVKYKSSQVPPENDIFNLSSKILDDDGGIIAGCFALLGSSAYVGIEMMWVDEQYRNSGIGSYVLGETERDAKEIGAYIALADAFDWQVPFFLKNGYKINCTLDDSPRGHQWFSLQKFL